MNVLVTETRGESKPIYWFLETIISDNPEESRAFVHIYACLDRMWAQRQDKDIVVQVYNPQKDIPGASWAPVIYHQYWLTVEIDADKNCYYLRSSQSHAFSEEHDLEIIESELHLHSTALIKHLPDLIKQAVNLASYRNVFISLDKSDENYL